MKQIILMSALGFFSLSSASATEVEKAVWIDYMESALPSYQCRDESYFRQCFKIDVEKCQDEMLAATKTCLRQEESKFPTKFNQPEDGTKWGTVVGACAGTKYELKLIQDRVSNANCNNINNWR